MKILFVNRKRGWFGGVEQHVAEAAAGLRRRGHECYLAYGEDARDAERYSRRFVSTWSAADLGGDGPSARELIARSGADVVYLHKIGGVAPWLGETPTVRMVHDHDLCCPRRHKYYALNGKVCTRSMGWRCWLDGGFVARDRSSRLGLRFVSIPAKQRELRRHVEVDRLLVGSQFMRDELLGNGIPADQVRILPPVMDNPPVALSQVETDPLVLCVGQLIRGKGVDLLLDALARIERPFRARLIGDGNAAPALQVQARRLGIADRVEFVGWVDHDQLAAHYRAARLVVVPSRWPEPFGMVGLEAMQQARPVVGFEVGGIPDWLVHEKTGLLVEEQDRDGLAAAIARLLGDPELARRMGQHGRRRAAAEFGFEGFLDALEQQLAVRS